MQAYVAPSKPVPPYWLLASSGLLALHRTGPVLSHVFAAVWPSPPARQRCQSRGRGDQPFMRQCCDSSGAPCVDLHRAVGESHEIASTPQMRFGPSRRPSSRYSRGGAAQGARPSSAGRAPTNRTISWRPARPLDRGLPVAQRGEHLPTSASRRRRSVIAAAAIRLLGAGHSPAVPAYAECAPCCQQVAGRAMASYIATSTTPWPCGRGAAGRRAPGR